MSLYHAPHRAFGGVAAWDGEGSPYTEEDEAITHQVTLDAVMAQQISPATSCIECPEFQSLQ